MKVLKLKSQKYSSIIANMNLGLLEVSNEDEILMSNQSFSEMSGYSQKELLGKKAKDLFLEGEYAVISTSEIDKRLEGISTSYELEVKTKEGEKKHWLISGATKLQYQRESNWVNRNSFGHYRSEKFTKSKRNFSKEIRKK